MIKIKNILALLPIIFLFLLTGSAFAQNGISNFAEGLPALKVESNGDAETTYSLSLQILALMTEVDPAPLHSARSYFIHQNNNCFVNTQTSYGNATNSTKPGSYSDSTFLNFLYYDPNTDGNK